MRGTIVRIRFESGEFYIIDVPHLEKGERKNIQAYPKLGIIDIEARGI
jgi:hypothetical protein